MDAIRGTVCLITLDVVTQVPAGAAANELEGTVAGLDASNHR